MIRKLKRRFIILAMTALFFLLAFIVTGMNFINYKTVVTDADNVLSVLSNNKGAFPMTGGDMGNRLPPNMSPETPYESRFFSVVLNSSYEAVNTDTSKIASIDSDTADSYAQEVIEKGKNKGFIDEFRYTVIEESDGVRIIFLDCGRRLDSFYSFLRASSGMALAGLCVVFVIIFILSGRIIRPVAESYEKQKQFITDAGHEIKTPLTIIGANVELLEMEVGENESLSDIAQQTKRLTSLTNDLVSLSRMEESASRLAKIEFPLSDVVAEAVHPFYNLAASEKKELICDIAPMLTVKGNDKTIRQLVSILLDNAVKYSPPDSKIAFNLAKHGRTVYISVENQTVNDISQEQFKHIFDRFYRTDASRNSKTGGHGIGLSVAKAIVSAHGGKISALSPASHTFRITAALPE